MDEKQLVFDIRKIVDKHLGMVRYSLLNQITENKESAEWKFNVWVDDLLANYCDITFTRNELLAFIHSGYLFKARELLVSEMLMDTDIKASLDKELKLVTT